MSVVSPLVRLRQALESHEPADAHTYVEPAQSASAKIARQIRLGSQGRKFLLVGPKGGGKSTELRALRRALNREVVPLGFDLDASGISAAGVSAFDVMYLSGLCFIDVLRRLDSAVAEERYRRLAVAYADGEEPEVEGRSLSEALANFSSFVDAVGPLASVVGVPEVATGVLSKSLKLGAVKLLSKRTDVVPETSPRGARMAAVCAELSQLLADRLGMRFCVLVDGLEKMNGESAERFKAMFERTRLLADAPWTAVFAAPPCTLTETHAAADLGYREQPVYGFPPEDDERKREILRLRLKAADASDVLTSEAEAALVARSGSLPRHLLRALALAVEHAEEEGAARVEREHAEAGLLSFARQLARGLDTESVATLRAVHERHALPRDEGAASLYADGRILSLPPLGNDIADRWMVHPLLEPLVGGDGVD